MAYIGKEPAEAFSSFQKQDFTTSATTSYTLDHPVTNENEIALFINFVRQEPTTAYTASNTTLTLTSATSASDDMYCVFLGKAVQTVNPPNSSVGNSQLDVSAINSQTAETSIAGGDEVLIYDTSASALKKMTRANFVSGIGGSNSSQFAAYGAAGQSINSNSWTKINIVNEFFDVDSDYDASNSKFVAPSAGKYFLYGQFAVARTGTFTGNPCLMRVRIYKNGSGIDYIGQTFGSTDGTRVHVINVSAVVDASASDYFEVYGFHDKGSAQNTGGESLLQGFKLIS